MGAVAKAPADQRIGVGHDGLTSWFTNIVYGSFMVYVHASR